MDRFGDAVNSSAATVMAVAAGPGQGPAGSGSGAGVGSGVGTNNPIVNPTSTPVPGSADAASGAPSIKRRAPIACRRCRRMRSKCVHEKGQPPCKACLEAGLGAEDCIFPVRGQPDNDREFRHPRMRSEKATSRRDPAKVRRDILDAPVIRTISKPIEEWERLPPLHDLVDGVNRFTRYYFQLGFIPKTQFPERLLNDHQSVSLFLVVSILSISARLTPALATRYGSGMKAAEFFMEKAAELAYGEIYAEPTLERCQAFYLLSIAQQGSELRNKSYINMGISMRMAALMQLHKEDTYRLDNPTPDLIIRAESARRTLWMLHSQDQLHSGPNSPVSLAAADITALLPCSEADFALGREPRSRAAVEDTPPALENPALITDPNRSLFASLIQAHHFWGIVGRRATTLAKSSTPWDPNSKFAMMVNKLSVWEEGLPREHLWSEFTFKGYKSEGQDLAYLGVTMIPRLCNIIIRRPYLADIINLFSKPQPDHHKYSFYANLSYELFLNVRQLFDQINAQFTSRSPDESVGAQMAAFCVYSCGLFATYLCKYQNICPDTNITRDGPMMLQRTISILMECKEVWPLATRWAESLEKFTRDHNITPNTIEGSMADGKDPVPHPVKSSTSSYSNSTATTSTHPIMTSSMTSTSPSSSSPSIYSRAGRSFEATPTSLQSPAEMIHPIPTQSLPTQMPHMLPTQYPNMPPPEQPFHTPQPQQLNPHMYIPPDNSVPTRYPETGVPNGVGMLIEAFDSTGQHPAAAQPYDLSNGNPAAFYPTTDGFDGELQFYFDGGQEWFPNGVFDGYG